MKEIFIIKGCIIISIFSFASIALIGFIFCIYTKKQSKKLKNNYLKKRNKSITELKANCEGLLKILNQAFRFLSILFSLIVISSCIGSFLFALGNTVIKLSIMWVGPILLIGPFLGLAWLRSIVNKEIIILASLEKFSEC